ncbi:hypothetical protein GON26_06535 [Flavobacterium sp. GA093]|uniref:Uncharacterized protein n=1 Tax=Flavobacterium hydrocarbonoxydans TaxID=2683249 RepID=A0A6I4NM84_9FLAO|nr:hypothetical protein [Flavobacterium hydrocarbonoxydans]MWB94012.1 hypothetical protein [Flavobacterium hydrocarbonoxydans]
MKKFSGEKNLIRYNVKSTTMYWDDLSNPKVGIDLLLNRLYLGNVGGNWKIDRLNKININEKILR